MNCRGPPHARLPFALSASPHTFDMFTPWVRRTRRDFRRSGTTARLFPDPCVFFGREVVTKQSNAASRVLCSQALIDTAGMCLAFTSPWPSIDHSLSFALAVASCRQRRRRVGACSAPPSSCAGRTSMMVLILSTNTSPRRRCHQRGLAESRSTARGCWRRSGSWVGVLRWQQTIR